MLRLMAKQNQFERVAVPESGMLRLTVNGTKPETSCSGKSDKAGRHTISGVFGLSDPGLGHIGRSIHIRVEGSQRRPTNTSQTKGARAVRYCIVFGGLSNKGSQSMVFTVIDQLKILRPEREIVVLSTNGYEEVPPEVRSCFAFRVLPWTRGLSTRCLGGWWAVPARFDRLMGSGKHHAFLPEIRSILAETDLAVDVSGYSLTSQWKADRSLKSLLNIAVCRKHGIRLFMFPQSFGPFAYPLLKKAYLFPLMRRYLGYPERIYAREEEGYEALKPFTGRNLRQTCDTVLQAGLPDPAHIYRCAPPYARPDLAIEAGSVAVIPSTRIIQQGKREELFPLFARLIALLLKEGKKVYIVRHTYQDLAVCRVVKDLFADEPRVRIIDDDLDSLDLIRLLGQCELVIAARYHAMVHAYKNAVPVLAFSWAVKYRGLLRLFGQERYLVDVRNRLDIPSVERLLQELLANRNEESARIAKHLEGLRRNTIFRDLG